MTDTPAAITLDATTRIAEVAALKETCDGIVTDLVVDASSVEAIDAAALQCLVAVGRHCTKMARTCRIETPSEAFLAAARTIGFEEALGVAGAGAGQPS